MCNPQPQAKGHAPLIERLNQEIRQPFGFDLHSCGPILSSIATTGQSRQHSSACSLLPITQFNQMIENSLHSKSVTICFTDKNENRNIKKTVFSLIKGCLEEMRLKDQNYLKKQKECLGPARYPRYKRDSVAFQNNTTNKGKHHD